MEETCGSVREIGGSNGSRELSEENNGSSELG